MRQEAYLLLTGLRGISRRKQRSFKKAKRPGAQLKAGTISAMRDTAALALLAGQSPTVIYSNSTPWTKCLTFEKVRKKTDLKA